MSAPDTTASPIGWIPHDGGECPVPGDVRVRVRLRWGGAAHLMSEEWASSREDCDWAHDRRPYDIVAYRIHPDDQHLVDAAKGKPAATDKVERWLVLNLDRLMVDFATRAEARTYASDARQSGVACVIRRVAGAVTLNGASDDE